MDRICPFSVFYVRLGQLSEHGCLPEMDIPVEEFFACRGEELLFLRVQWNQQEWQWEREDLRGAFLPSPVILLLTGGYPGIFLVVNHANMFCRHSEKVFFI